MAEGECRTRKVNVNPWDNWWCHEGVELIDTLERAVRKAVAEWFDADGEEIIRKAVDKEVSTLFLIYGDNIMTAFTVAIEQQRQKGPQRSGK